jgi:hypothetical protein
VVHHGAARHGCLSAAHLIQPGSDDGHGGLSGSWFQNGLGKVLARIEVEIVKRADQVKGFAVLPKRRIVERTFAWLSRCRRLAHDWENLNASGLAFLRLASIRLMVRKLRNPA